MRISDCFVLFDLPNTASKSEVKLRYRELVKQFHPDSNVPSTSRDNFEKVQHAYETISAFFDFNESHSYEDISVHDKRLERIKRAQKRQKEKRQREIENLHKAIADFRKTRVFILSKTLAVFSVVLALFLVFDFSAPSQIEYEPIVKVVLPILKTDETGILYLKNRTVSLSTRDLNVMQDFDFVLIEKTPYFNHIKQIYIIANNTKVPITYRSFYNPSIVILFLLLFMGAFVFAPNKNTVQYYMLIRYYNLYVLTPLVLYVLFGNNHLLYLLGLLE